MITDDIKVIKFSNKESNEWLDLRKTYIGASEVGIILGLNKYQTKKDLLLNKLGYKKQMNNPELHFGRIFEHSISEICNYYETSLEETLQNYSKNNRKRNLIYEYDYFLVSYKDISIIVSPDYKTIENDVVIPYEIKSTNKYVNINSIDIAEPSHIWQNIFQQLCYKSPYGYVFTCVWGKMLDLNLVELTNYLPLLEGVFLEIESFYKDLETYKNEDISVILNTYETDITVNIDNLNIAKEKNGTIIGTNDDELFAQKYMVINDYIKDINNHKEQIRQYFTNRYLGAYKIDTDMYSITLGSKFTIKRK